MSEAQVPNSIERLENYYQEQTIGDREVLFGGISDSISYGTSFCDDLFPDFDSILTSDDNIMSHDSTRTINAIPVFTPENSSAGNSNNLSPKATVAKQVRRRSRASRRTPTTLLNASIKNFRTLVQQYTGCHSATSDFKSGKGPITLSFGSSSSNEQNNFPAPSFLTAFGRGTYNYTDDQQAQFQEKQQYYKQQHIDQVYQTIKSSFSSSENTSEVSAFSDVVDHLY
ncbi:hypothetical protein ACH5RR_018507 [Cinchona calisaya]|uniref:VQ domain-containing protein n=1 Tax=Cinchona calisaya TaxID=153742 RepID=A0ABD2ZMX5_9GENT